MKETIVVVALIAAAVVVYLAKVREPALPAPPPPVTPPITPPVVPPVRPPVPPVTPPVRPPVAPPVAPPPVLPPGIQPLPNADWERIRQAFAADFRWREGIQWRKAESRFLADTQPGMPGSASVEAIQATYRRIYAETVGVAPPVTPPVVPPVVPPVRPPVVPPVRPPVMPPDWDRPLPDIALEKKRQFFAGVIKRHVGANASKRFLGETAPGTPGGMTLEAMATIHNRIMAEGPPIVR